MFWVSEQRHGSRGGGGGGAKFKGGPTVLERAMKPNHVMVVVLN